MSIEIDKQITQKIKIKSLKVFAKISDRGAYTYIDDFGDTVKETEWYVPTFINDGEDYLDIEIDLETGQILNWKKPTGEVLKSEMYADGQD
jgi:hypothetical protein